MPASPARSHQELLSGWGRTAPARCRVESAAGVEQVRAAVLGSTGRGVLARGGGRSYGDAAQNSGGGVLRLAGGVQVDPAARTARAGGGATLHEVLDATLPHGLCLPVLPGTGHATVGGALAADVHGKNHLAAGSLGAQVDLVELVDGTGELRTLQPQGPTAPQYWATVAGMGLTGVVVAVTLRLVPVQTSQVVVEDVRGDDLAAVLAALEVAAHTWPYAVAWVDALPRRRGFGRGIVSRARHLVADELDPDTDPLGRAPHRALPAPPAPLSVVRPWTVRAFDALWWARRTSGPSRLPLGAYFHQLDAVAGWNRLYGPGGFVQHQCVVPLGSEDALEQVVRRLAPCSPFLGTVKRFGAADLAPLSFPRPGWSLTLDLPARAPGLARALDDADQLVAAAGGAVYLAKDARLAPELLAAMYPRLAGWQDVQAGMDPYGRFRSDLDRRLGLVRRA